MPRLKKVLESHNNKLHVKKDDTVIVITGKDKGKKGRVIAAYPRQNRVLGRRCKHGEETCEAYPSEPARRNH